MSERASAGQALSLRSSDAVIARWLHASAVIMNAEAVADTGLRDDMDGAFGLRLDLLAQLPDIVAQILHFAPRAPHLLHEKAVGQHHARMQDEQAQDLVFLL